MTTTPPRVFISYSWDSESHRAWVRVLAERLVANGVDVRLDQWHLAPGQSLTQFMEQAVLESDHVVVVCTPSYRLRSLERRGGVGYEQQIIAGDLLTATTREKFIPVIRDGDFEIGPACAIPPQFMGIYALDMRTDVTVDAAFETLLRAIYKKPLYEAPRRGLPPAWLEEQAQEEEEIRLATIDLDGWALRSGLAQHHRTPDSFSIPSELDRRELMLGDIVKLMFEISIPSDPDDPEAGESFGERMWTIVVGKVGPYYIGELDNVPATFGKQENLGPGDTVVFLPEHVIDIDTSARGTGW